MRVASGTGLCNEDPLAGLCRDRLTAEFWKIRPPVGPPSGQQDGCGSGAARPPARGNEREDCHRGKHDYGEPRGGRYDRARSREDHGERGLGWNAERGFG